MERKAVYYVIIAGASALLMYACNPAQPPAESLDAPLAGPAEARVADTEPLNFLSDSAGLSKAQQALMQLPKFKDKQVLFHSDIHFYADGRIVLKLQDPDRPENLDEYTYSGGNWTEPDPVRTSASDNFNEKLLPLADIKFTIVSMIFEEIKLRSAAIESPDPVTHIYFLNSPVFSRKEWYASVTGPRDSYSVRADMSGKVIEFERN